MRFLLSAAAVLLIASRAAAVCPGDCNGDGRVAVDELVLGVNVGLGTRPVSACPAFDRNASGGATIDELLAAVRAALDGCPVEPIFPADYRSTYTEVRDCRFSIEHGGTMIRVLANPIGAGPYLDLESPLPAGSVVVKEEYGGVDCNDERELVRWRVMRKEAPGFDPEDGDWHWQWVDPDRTVRFDDKSTCIGCHRAPDCLERDYMCTHDDAPPRGRLALVLHDLPGALLSVSGSSAADVYAVGADPGDGLGPLVLHYDGNMWTRLPNGVSGDLWWVSDRPIGGDFYMSGAGGLIVQYDPESGAFTRHTTPGTETIYGIWGTAPDSLWAAGGDDDNVETSGVVWRFDGETWTAQDLSAVNPAGVPLLFKIWGRSDSDVYAVGARGVILHYDGTSWSPLTSPVENQLFTVHGNDSITAAVGGFFFNGMIAERAGDAFVSRRPDGTPQMNGVFIPPDGRGVAVGREGAIAVRTSSGWELRDSGLDTILDFHATWVDPAGGIWAVGGDLSIDLNQGMLAYGGRASVGSGLQTACPRAGGELGAPTVSWANDVAPLLAARGCLNSTCHGGVFPASGYDLRTYAASFVPGIYAESLDACSIVPGRPERSFLIEKLGVDPRLGVQMPNGLPPLSAEEIERITTWVREGAADN